MDGFFIGIMSGTSLDGIDCALIEVQQNQIHFHSGASHAFDTQLKNQLENLVTSRTSSLTHLGTLNIQLGEAYANAVAQLCEQTQTTAAHIKAIGCHGQTILHHPHSPHPFSIQLGSAHVLHQKTQVPVITDFRSMDMALGGQGAPLAPIFHQALLGQPHERVAVVNIGGLANISLLNPDQPPTGFDTGPGNTLMDLWSQQHLNAPFDNNGDWAASGKLLPDVLAQLLQDPYFKQKPPKSTGRESFNLAWLQQILCTFNTKFKPEDIQRTLCQLTAQNISEAIDACAPQTRTRLVCGGGSKNACLMRCLRDLSRGYTVSTTDTYGVDSHYMEATGFAWLAHQRLNNIRIDLTHTTGGSRPCLLGHIIES